MSPNPQSEQTKQVSLLDLRFFIITMALRNIRISTSLWKIIRDSNLVNEAGGVEDKT